MLGYRLDEFMRCMSLNPARAFEVIPDFRGTVFITEVGIYVKSFKRLSGTKREMFLRHISR